MMTTLREQIESLPRTPYRDIAGAGPTLSAVLAIIDSHRCIDRERLARALPGVMSQEVTDQVYEPGTDPLDCPEEWFMTPRDLADRIIAALEKP